MQKTFECEIYVLNAAQEIAPEFCRPFCSDVLVSPEVSILGQIKCSGIASFCIHMYNL